MSAASNLIERMEKETGQRVDSNDGDNNAVAGLLGAMSRLLGQTPTSYTEQDDVAAGLLIKHHMSPEWDNEEAQNEKMTAMLLSEGMAPDELKGLTVFSSDRLT